MLEAYLPKPPVLADKTEVPLGVYEVGTIKDVNNARGTCIVITKTARFMGHVKTWDEVLIDTGKGEVRLSRKKAVFDAERGGYYIDLPDDLLREQVYFRAEPGAPVGRVTYIKNWFLLQEHESKFIDLKTYLYKLKKAYDAAPIYSVNLIRRSQDIPYADNVRKTFVARNYEKREQIFLGSDVERMRTLVGRYLPHTRECEVEIVNHGTSGRERTLCTRLPWNNAEFRRIDQLALTAS